MAVMSQHPSDEERHTTGRDLRAMMDWIDTGWRE
ncbi:MAG: hypothetical protein AVDCRST_MAG67-2210 [uncultured Solirubrobacteraceae bacterium]|uniref:Uncharacterized protein n=1 Tax=uncultured Solirubrobacteraceae bacterium TaxID=1162706 RepID=A0A6J4S1V8_9ACTN|nr:MAG: hypothetical protein AVDCRST_MAG67-2210 [uncultured Solirubrobacteraceae bacterium]